MPKRLVYKILNFSADSTWFWLYIATFTIYYFKISVERAGTSIHIKYPVEKYNAIKLH